jgi:DNA-binding CsgD family transcriptional regulator
MGDKGAVRLKRILANRSKTDLEEAVLLIAGQLGFQYFMFHGCLAPSRGASHDLRFDNFPAGWRRYCADLGKDLLPGPLRRLALQEVTPLPWNKIAARQSRPFAKAGKFGLGTGVSCSVHGPHGQWSLTSFALARTGPSAERHILAVLPDCQLVACAVHYTAARIARRGLDPAAPPLRFQSAHRKFLSDRERQCLIQSAGGKTTSEIGQALQISERTVVFHLSNVRRKLGAANSRHAVTKAFSLKLIAAGP